MSDYEMSLQKALEKYRPNIKLIRIGFLCPECGHEWGVKIDGLNDIPLRDEAKFICFECAKRRGLRELIEV